MASLALRAPRVRQCRTARLKESIVLVRAHYHELSWTLGTRRQFSEDYVPVPRLHQSHNRCRLLTN